MTTAPPEQTWAPNTRNSRWTCPAVSLDAYAFHRSLDGYTPTPLVDLPDLALELKVGRILAKDESSRLGLPAFKALGASWAVHRALQDRRAAGPVTVVTATDGNHGRAVARFARTLGHHSAIYLPDGVHPDAVRAIESEGAVVTIVGGSYDDAVASAAAAADGENAILVQDTAWDGYEEIPRWVVEGYATLFFELDAQLRQAGLGPPGMVAVPVGVGSLLQAALSHYRSVVREPGTSVLSVEPDSSACVLASIHGRQLLTVETGQTIMAGLNCGTPSTLAWPYIINGLDAAISVSDADAAGAALDLVAAGVDAGPCGAAGLAGVRKALTGPGGDARRNHLGVRPNSTVVLLVTEGNRANPVA